MTESTDPNVPDLEIPDFDPKRTRRAVRMGVVRTALTVLVLLLVIALLATVGSGWIQRRGDRDRRMYEVLGTALQIANPGYRIQLGEISTAPLSMSLKVGISPVRAVGGFTFTAGPEFADRKDEITQDFFGRVQHPPLGHDTETSLTYDLYDIGTGNGPKKEMREVLARLPQTMAALAVVEFATPMTSTELLAFARQYGECPDIVVYEKRPRATPITGSIMTRPASMDPPKATDCRDTPPETLEGFRGWVGMLREHDEHNLRQFGLDLARLRKAAAEGKAYAFVDPISRIRDLRKMIEDPRVTTIRVSDIAFDLDKP
ncbi:hypothetical protein Sru01_57080 [Sphaerisporangium rufum]|uniref:Uncharacterized protein n=1 Tax=Sphaerisporangium rufum TaxID=1381558 RepID=A0A919V140_9ACTN|nr:hypothetical protein [Sphaerisporangium rufum]GII80726.1 hypothetical protein Sru01_57080 [Sphaerisporangium rufum]